jgi:hypothetical protein
MTNATECGRAIEVIKQSRAQMSKDINVVLRFEYHVPKLASSSEKPPEPSPNTIAKMKNRKKSMKGEPNRRLI